VPRAGSPAAPDPLPDVHISIGSLEVREAQQRPATQAKPRTERQPTIRLADYLAQRQGGRK
jgi:hypothetical protein